LPVHYFHVVFTMPHALNELFLQNQRTCSTALFQAAAKTLSTVAYRRIGAKLGFFSILHTWGQMLDLHPHLHCVVPGGGLSGDGESWIATSKKRRYFAPVRVLAEVFRGILVKRLRRLFRQGKLAYAGDFEQLIATAIRRRWVVHAQPPFGSATQVLKYLSRYTRKVALSNARLVALDGEMVSFSFKDYADGSQKKLCRMKASEFIRRFLMHIPPPGFVRIRYYGFMAGKHRHERIARIREVIAGLLPVPVTHPKTDGSFRPGCCPRCGAQALHLSEMLPKQPRWRNSS
jgi:hypothetical protein